MNHRYWMLTMLILMLSACATPSTETTPAGEPSFSGEVEFRAEFRAALDSGRASDAVSLLWDADVRFRFGQLSPEEELRFFANQPDQEDGSIRRLAWGSTNEPFPPGGPLVEGNTVRFWNHQTIKSDGLMMDLEFIDPTTELNGDLLTLEGSYSTIFAPPREANRRKSPAVCWCRSTAWRTVCTTLGVRRQRICPKRDKPIWTA